MAASCKSMVSGVVGGKGGRVGRVMSTWLLTTALCIAATAFACDPPPDATKTWSADTPISAEVAWPTPPVKGFTWDQTISFSVWGGDGDKLTFLWVDPYTHQPEQCDEFHSDAMRTHWTCSWGDFIESGQPTADDFFEVNWQRDPNQDPSGQLVITCTVDDACPMGPGEGGSRNDDPVTRSRTLEIRYPQSITVRFQPAPAEPPLYNYCYYNISKVLDNRGNPFEGCRIEQDLANPFTFTTSNHLGSPDENSLTWMCPDVAILVTDENGELKDKVRNESLADAQMDGHHKLKRVYTQPSKPELKVLYWNPKPNPDSCNSPHGYQWGTVQ